MSKPNWGLLLEQNRCKAIGIPWTEAELKAIYELKIPADFVRNGCLNQEQYQSELNKIALLGGGRQLRYMTRPELVVKAQSLGIEIPTDDVTKNEIVHLIEQAQNATELPDVTPESLVV